MSNHLNRAAQESAIHCLLEGTSVRSAERMTRVHRDTILRLLCRVGTGCQKMMDSEIKNLTSKRLQLDEIWAFVGKKQRHLVEEDEAKGFGDVWTFVALDADSKLVPTFKVGKRNSETAQMFVDDLASRLSGRVQLSSDAFNAYLETIDNTFGAGVDYGQIVKVYEAEPVGPGRYSPPKVTRADRQIMIGSPDEAHIPTSYVERQNLTMRMNMRRFTRLTNAFLKKMDNLKAAVALHFAYYNFVRVHQTLRVTPAVEAGITGTLWSLSDLMGVAFDFIPITKGGEANGQER